MAAVEKTPEQKAEDIFRAVGGASAQILPLFAGNPIALIVFGGITALANLIASLLSSGIPADKAIEAIQSITADVAGARARLRSMVEDLASKR